MANGLHQDSRIITVVPCRMKSTRLPGKATRPIYGVPSIERCLLNTLAITRSEVTVLATSAHPEDTVLEQHNLDGRVAVVRGSEDDVLQRFFVAIEQLEADIVVRVTGDCPVVSYEIADMLIESHLRTGADMTYCRWGEFPVGINSEVYSVTALRRLKGLMPDTSYSEYLNAYFKNNPDYFTLNEVQMPDLYRHPEWRLTLDEPVDLELFELLFSTLGIEREPIAFEQIVQFFADNPAAAAINAHVAVKYASNNGFVRFLNQATTIKAD